MRVFIGVVTVALLLFFQGCGDSNVSKIDGTQKFRFFNARKVNDEMHVILQKNGITELNTSIKYAKDKLIDISWVENDTFKFYYTQGDMDISVSNIEPIDGMKIIVSIGNETQESLPLIIDGPDNSDLISSRAIIKVINAMNGDIKNHINDELMLQIRSQSIYDSELLKLGEMADTDKVIGSAKSLITVLDDRYNSLYQETHDIFNAKAYAIIMYEKEFDDNQPEVDFFDVTP